MKIAGGVLAALVVAGIYLTWSLSWSAVLAAAVIGVVMTQVGHAKDWREVFTTAGSACLFAAVVGALLLLLLLFMG